MTHVTGEELRGPNFAILIGVKVVGTAYLRSGSGEIGPRPQAGSQTSIRAVDTRRQKVSETQKGIGERDDFCFVWRTFDETSTLSTRVTTRSNSHRQRGEEGSFQVLYNHSIVYERGPQPVGEIGYHEITKSWG